MRPPSSPSDPPGLFDDLQARGPVRDAVSDTAWLQALLDTEAALAKAQAAEGLIPHAHATAIAQHCHAHLFDITALAHAAAGTPTPTPTEPHTATGTPTSAPAAAPAAATGSGGGPGARSDAGPGAASGGGPGARSDAEPGARSDAEPGARSDAEPGAASGGGPGARSDAEPGGGSDAGSGVVGGPGNPVLPLVRELRARVGGEVAGSVHFGATSQDVLDTAGMLVAHRALGALLEDVGAAAGAAARLARDYRAAPMAGRTLLQLAEPVTFGMTAAGWLVALDEAADRLREVRHARLAVQVGGAVGRPVAYQAKMALELGLASPLLPWHTNRSRVAELAGALGGAAGVIGKVARDITLLAQGEVAEVSEASPGASSAMAHKRNPIAAIMAVSCAMQAPGLVATLLAAMVQEHGRAAGAWHAEWRPQRELLISTGSAAAWLRASLDGLRVHEEAMRANLALLGTADVDGAVRAATVFVDRALAAHETREGR